jgi:hypothetical protein
MGNEPTPRHSAGAFSRKEAEVCACGHTDIQHGLRRCLALLSDSDEPCPCGRGYLP